MEIPQNNRSRITILSNNPTPRHLSSENHNLKRYMHSNIHGNTIYNSNDMEATYMCSDRGMDKEDMVHM